MQINFHASYQIPGALLAEIVTALMERPAKEVYTSLLGIQTTAVEVPQGQHTEPEDA